MPYRLTPLRPPVRPLDRDVRWVLLAAFAGRLPKHELPESPARAAHLVRQFGLVQQIATRRRHDEIALALGVASAQSLTDSASRSTMRSLAVTQARNAVLRIANQAQVDVALLKGAALELLEVIKPGERYFTDVDVLVSQVDQNRLKVALLDGGFTAERRKVHVNDVVVVRSGTDVGVELHTKIRDLQLATGSSAELGVLLDAHLLVPAGDQLSRQSASSLAMPQPSTGLFLPTLALLAAHLVIQGWYLFHFVPHAPRHKTPMRVLVDLSLLNVHSDPALAQRIFGYVQHVVPEAEFTGLTTLVAALANGQTEDVPSNAECALHHIIAATIDENYRRSLMIERQRFAVHGEGLLGWMRRQLTRLIVPSPAEIQDLVTRGKARGSLDGRIRIASRLVARGIRGGWASIVRRRYPMQ